MKKINGVFSVIFAVLAVAGIILLVSGTFQRRFLYPLKYENTIAEYSDIYGLDRSTIYGVIKAESGFDARSTSKKGAKGLMQITDSTAAFIAERLKTENFDVYDPQTNLQFGCWYLSYLMTRFGVRDTALAAYNAGEGTVAKWLDDERYSSDGLRLKNIPYAETSEYVKKVVRYADAYKTYYKMK